MKRLINDIRSNLDIYLVEFGIAVVLLVMFAALSLGAFAIWGNV